MLDGSVSFRRVVQLRTIRKLGCSASSCRETTVPLSCLNARPEGSTQGNVADKPSSGFVNTTPLIRTNPRNAANLCVARYPGVTATRGGSEPVSGQLLPG